MVAATKLAVWPDGMPPDLKKCLSASLKLFLPFPETTAITNFVDCAINHPAQNAINIYRPSFISILYHGASPTGCIRPFGEVNGCTWVSHYPLLKPLFG
jgi:hypothetical protein